MKRYIIVILLIGVILSSVLIYNTMKVEQRIYKTFAESGYILQSKKENENEVERYYFSGEQKYKENYNKQITFEDTNGDKVVTNKNNFIHYTDGSISAFENGVLVELTGIESDPIFYYNILANSTLTKLGDKYIIQNLNKQLSFTYPLWKISANKYLLAGTEMRIVFEDGTEKIINGYLEIEYLDNKVVKIYNQEIIYQTIGEDTTIYLSEDIEIKLGSKIISKNGENQMSLENMVIDSEDNVTIVDIGNEKEEEEELQTQISNNQNGGTTNNNQQSTNQNDSSQNNGSTNLPQINGNGSGNVDGIVDNNPEIIQAPKFKVTSFELSSTGLIANITVTDEEALLKEDTRVKVIRAETGKIVYENTYPLGEYEISLDVQSLSPNTEYILQVESGYQVEDIVYQKNFIYKSFRTNATGINFEKDVFTNTSMSFKVKFEGNSQIAKADLKLIGANGQELQEQEVVNPSDVNGGEVNVEFAELEPNTTYEIKLTNVLYDGRILVNAFDIIQKHMTLKNRPTISGVEYETDKREGQFILRISNVEDAHKAITKYRYEIYDSRMGVDALPVKIIETDKTEVTVPVENVKIDENGTVETIEGKIIRNVPYYYKVIAIYNDNEKICETESEYSNQMSMDGVEVPTVRFQKEKVTFERIEGLLIIEDNGNAVMIGEDSIIHVTYSDSLGNTETITSQGSLNIPISINNLRANETYKFAVYGKVDLKDGNDPIDEYYIGGAIVKTAEPENLVANFKQDRSDINNRFNIDFKLIPENAEGEELEAKTLTGMKFRIYSGQPDEEGKINGELKKEILVIDENTAAYESTLKEKYYDNSIEITPEVLGLNNIDLTEDYYTITVSDAYDYTKYENELPIMNSMFVIGTNNVMPDLPTDLEKAIDVIPIRNGDTENPTEKLGHETIVGYHVKANFDNSEKIAKVIRYRVYNAITNVEVEVKEVNVGEDGIIPEATFEVGNGTSYTTVDLEGMKRGNKYYFTYEVDVDLNSDGVIDAVYPKDKNQSVTVIKSMTVLPKKEAPKIVMYPSSSTKDTRTYKYMLEDVDKALITNNITALIGETVVDTIYNVQETGTGAFGVLLFENLQGGHDLSIKIKQAVDKTLEEKEVLLVEEYFEGENVIENLGYKVELEGNNILIKLQDLDGNTSNIQDLEKIAAFQVKLTAIDGSKGYITELKVPSNNNILSINFHEIGNLINTEVKVELIAYYDTGKVGYEMSSDYILLQKAHIQAEEKYYYALNDEKSLVENPSIKGQLYKKELTQKVNEFGIVNAVDGNSNNFKLNLNQNGIMYNYDVVLQKAVASKEIACTGNNIIKFNRIIPGISLEDDKGNLRITSELEEATITAKFIVTGENAIQDNNIYIELYELDDTGAIISVEERVITLEESEFNKSKIITLSGLSPKTHYAIKFKAKIKQSENEYDYLDDVDSGEIGRMYYFSTLTNVGISDINVEYVANKYEDKYIKLTYKLDRTIGYDAIRYKLTKKNISTGEYEEIQDLIIEDDKVLNKDMEKIINANPGGKIEFGADYKIEIIPIAEITTQSGETKEIELERGEHEIHLAELIDPIVAITGKRVDNDNQHNIEFKITIHDKDRVVVGDKYKIKILDYNGADITPDNIRGTEYSVDDINKNIIVEDVEKNREYIIRIIVDVDYDNDGNIDENEFIKEYKVSKTNEYGISIGTIVATKNKEDSKKIDMRFSGSYKLEDIKKIKYSIYNTSGYVSGKTVEFIPSVITAGEEQHYMCTLEGNIEKSGTYYIQIQFIKETEDGEEIIIEDKEIQYVYQ